MTTDWQQHININPEVRFGKPCITGTRISVGDILGWLAGGMSQWHILEDFPELRPEHLQAALLFAASREGAIKTLVA